MTNLSTTFLSLFTWGTSVSNDQNGGPLFGIGLLLVVAVIGLAQVFLPRYRFIARIAVIWALVPPLVLLPVITLRPNLIMARYLVFTIPGWAILAGLGGALRWPIPSADGPAETSVSGGLPTA